MIHLGSQRDPRFSETMAKVGATATLVIPLARADEIYGVVYLDPALPVATSMRRQSSC
jgi:hypothetical protein